MNAANDPESESPLKFPCSFPIKIMGRQQPGFREAVLALIIPHSGDIGPEQVQSRESSNGSFVSITVTIVAQSREQLDAIYMSLTADDQVLFVL